MRLLEDLRQLGFTVVSLGDRIQVRHPAPEPPAAALPLLDELRRRKSEALEALVTRAAAIEAVLGLPLSRFERDGQPLELATQWFEDTLWFVPEESHAVALAQRGVSRGRLWTARELMSLHQLPGLTEDYARTLAIAKIEFGGQLMDVSPPEDRPGAAPQRVSNTNGRVPPVRAGAKKKEPDMGIKFRATANAPPAPEGTYTGKLTKVEERTNSNGDFLVWFFAVPLDGKDRTVTGTTSAYFTSKARSRLWSEAILGRAIKQEEEIDLEALYGRECRLVVVHKKREDGSSVSRVENVLPASNAEEIPF